MLEQFKRLIQDPILRGRVSERTFIDVIKNLKSCFEIVSAHITRDNPKYVRNRLDDEGIDVVVFFRCNGKRYTALFQIKSSAIGAEIFKKDITKQHLSEWVEVVKMHESAELLDIELQVLLYFNRIVEEDKNLKLFLDELVGRQRNYSNSRKYELLEQLELEEHEMAIEEGKAMVEGGSYGGI